MVNFIAGFAVNLIAKCMADAMGAAFSSSDAALSIVGGRWSSHDRNTFHGTAGAQSAAGDCAALVVPEPVPRLARRTTLPGMHEIVRPGFRGR
jgi:hypothetical protein